MKYFKVKKSLAFFEVLYNLRCCRISTVYIYMELVLPNELNHITIYSTRCNYCKTIEISYEFDDNFIFVSTFRKI